MVIIESEQDADAKVSDQLAELTRKITETETALKVLLAMRERHIDNLHKELKDKLRNLVLPLEHFKKTSLTPQQLEIIEILEQNLANISDPTCAKLLSPELRLSPTEVKVARLIRSRKTDKEIARMLNLSRSTILTHRHHIREKLGIKNKKVNLQSYLAGLSVQPLSSADISLQRLLPDRHVSDVGRELLGVSKHEMVNLSEWKTKSYGLGIEHHAP
jgi:DNA-binding CsgD family transcriptional regulator